MKYLPHIEVSPGAMVSTKVLRDTKIDGPLGVVIEVETHKRVSWTSVIVWVRWIGTENQADDGMTSHDASELIVVSTTQE